VEYARERRGVSFLIIKYFVSQKLNLNSNPTTLEPKDWTTILKTNKTMFGFVIREEQKDIVKSREAGKSNLSPCIILFGALFL
jgi:hypothetical protein